MKKTFFVLAALAFSGCQAERSDESSLAAADGQSSTFEVAASPSRTLAAGRYLVSIETTGACLDRTINLKQSYEYPDSNPEKAPTVTLESDGRETDNLARPAICRANTKDTGSTIVTLAKSSKIRAKGFGAKITSIEKIEKTGKVSMTHLGNLFAGEYILSVTRPMACTPSTFTSKKHTQIEEAGRRLELSFGSVVIDNLIRPMICVAPGTNATDSGVVYLRSVGGQLPITGKGGLKIEKIERITKKSSL